MITAITAGDIAIIIGSASAGAAVLIAAVTGGVAAIRAVRVLPGVVSSVDEVKTAVGSAAVETSAINMAVNHKESGMPTLVAQVTTATALNVQLAEDLAEERAYAHAVFEEIAHKLDIRLPSRPPTVRPPHKATS